MQNELTIERHTLTEVQLLEYAKVSTKVRRTISARVASLGEESKDQAAEANADLVDAAVVGDSMPVRAEPEDFYEDANPVHKGLKKRKLH